MSRPSVSLDRREFSDGLLIQINRTSPAFAALEDVVTSFESEMDDLSPFTPMEIIAAGESGFDSQAREIIASNMAIESQLARQELERDIEAPSQLRQVAQQSKMENASAGVLSNLGAIVVDSKNVASVASHPITDVIEEARAQADPGSILVSGSRAVLLDEDKAETASTVQPVEHPSRTIRVADLNIDKEELLRSLFFPLVTADQNAAKNQIAGIGGTPTKKSGARRDLTSQQEGRLGGLASRTRSTNNIEKTVNSQGLVEDQVSNEQTMHQLLISGPVEMTGGLAVTSSSDQIVVYREEEGERLESGYVWIRDGRYEIYVQETVGDLVGELQTVNGDVLGQGRVELAALVSSGAVAPAQYRLDGQKLVLRPVIKGLRGQVVSAYSHGTKVMAVAGAEVDLEEVDQSLVTGQDGRFDDPDLLQGSSVVTKVRKHGHWGTLAFVEAGQDLQITMFPDAMMSAFRALNGVSADAPVAIVWGRVTRESHPIAGAKVEMLTGEEEVEPIYFNSLLIPDPNLKSTSANGVYAFIVKEPGVHAVQASFGTDTLDPVLFPMEVGFVSSVDLETTRSRKLDIRVFDAFRPSVAIAAEIVAVGGESLLSIGASGRGTLRYAPGTGLIAFDVDGGREYARTRVSVPRERRFAFAPMIEQDWIEELRNHRRISKTAGSGTAVGFVDASGGYQVHVRPEQAARAATVVYFDPKGNALRSSVGVSGGGYVIFNLPEGFTTISVATSSASKLHSVTALAESGVINVFNHTLR